MQRRLKFQWKPLRKWLMTKHSKLRTLRTNVFERRSKTTSSALWRKKRLVGFEILSRDSVLDIPKIPEFSYETTPRKRKTKNIPHKATRAVRQRFEKSKFLL